MAKSKRPVLSTSFDLAEIGLDEFCIGIETGDDLACGVSLLGARRADLVEDHDIGELDLLDEEIYERSVVAVASRLTPVS